MRYIIILILFLISIPGGESHAQERIAYRVEVIILRLVESDFPPLPSPELRDFSHILDLGEAKQQRDTWNAWWSNLEPTAVSDIEIRPPLTPEASQFMYLEGIEYIPEMTEQMSGVWRNLRLSGEYRPEVYLSWQQAAQGSFPALRLHNQEFIRIDDDFSDRRIEFLIDDPENPMPAARFFQYDFATGALTTAPFPDPVEHFSLDGEIKLRRSRFLHIDLDLEYRQPTPAMLAGLSGPPLLMKHQGYAVQPLKQSRQVRTGRMEYFDSPVLGALIWVTGINKPEEEPGE